MKTYIIATAALALALGIAPAMAKSGGGGSSGGASGQSGTFSKTINQDLVGAGQDNDYTPPDASVAQPHRIRISASCAAILKAPKTHSKTQVEACMPPTHG